MQFYSKVCNFLFSCTNRKIRQKILDNRPTHLLPNIVTQNLYGLLKNTSKFEQKTPINTLPLSPFSPPPNFSTPKSYVVCLSCVYCEPGGIQIHNCLRPAMLSASYRPTGVMYPLCQSPGFVIQTTLTHCSTG